MYWIGDWSFHMYVLLLYRCMTGEVSRQCGAPCSSRPCHIAGQWCSCICIVLETIQQHLAPLIPHRKVITTTREGEGVDSAERGGLNRPVGVCGSRGDVILARASATGRST